MRSSWLPTSTTRPSAIATMTSESRMVESRWAITKLVRPRIMAVSASWSFFSVRGVDARGRLVEDEDGPVGQDDAGDRDELALSLTEVRPAAGEHRLVAVG